MIDNTQNAHVLESEPLKGYMPADVRQWLQENTNEIQLADAFAQVSNKVGVLMHIVDEKSDSWLDEAYSIWRDLESELYSKITRILEEENWNFSVSHKISGMSPHYIVLPFMERNGYRDNAGWWHRVEPNNLL